MNRYVHGFVVEAMRRLAPVSPACAATLRAFVASPRWKVRAAFCDHRSDEVQPRGANTSAFGVGALEAP
jgi:hypothetical protein